MDQNVCKRFCLFPADRMQRIHCELEFAVGKFLDQENDGRNDNGNDTDRSRKIFVEDGELALALLDLFGTGLERLELVGREAVLRALDRGEQEVAVVRAVLDHGAVFVGRQKHLVPEVGVCGENVVFLLHELLIELGRFVGAVRLGRDQGRDVGAAVRLVLAFALRARRETEHHREREQERHELGHFFRLHHDSSV